MLTQFEHLTLCLASEPNFFFFFFFFFFEVEIELHCNKEGSTIEKPAMQVQCSISACTNGSKKEGVTPFHK